MALIDDLTQKVHGFAFDSWGHIPNAYVLPDADDLTFGNSGERLDVCILYADIHRSTEMVDDLPDTKAASYYKAFLHCAAKLVKENDGTIQAYDGDRIMGVFIGASRVDNAVVAALQLNNVVSNVINPEFESSGILSHRPIKHTVGIDAGKVLVAKTGVRVDNDLVWVGSAANYAAKLNSFEGLDVDYATRITSDAYALLSSQWKLHGVNSMWEGPYNNLKKKTHYRSSYFLRM